MSVETPAHAPRRPGRPPVCPPEVVVQVLQLRCQGLSYGAISAVLNDEGVPTPMGGSRWLKSHVDRLLHTRYAREIAKEHDPALEAVRLTLRLYDSVSASQENPYR